MHLTRLIALALMMSFAVPAVAVVPTPDRSMKGWELASWTDARTGKLRLSLVGGTNRLKTEAEITESHVDLAGMAKRFAGLARGEQIFWHATPRLAGPRTLPFALPAAASQDYLRTKARQLGLKLTIIP